MPVGEGQKEKRDRSHSGNKKIDAQKLVKIIHNEDFCRYKDREQHHKEKKAEDISFIEKFNNTPGVFHNKVNSIIQRPVEQVEAG